MSDVANRLFEEVLAFVQRNEMYDTDATACVEFARNIAENYTSDDLAIAVSELKLRVDVDAVREAVTKDYREDDEDCYEDDFDYFEEEDDY